MKHMINSYVCGLTLDRDMCMSQCYRRHAMEEVEARTLYSLISLRVT